MCTCGNIGNAHKRTFMDHINFVKFRQHLSEYVGRAHFAKERVIVTQRKKVVGAFVPIEDLETILALEDQRDLEAFREAMKEDFEDWDIVKKRLLKKRRLKNDEVFGKNSEES